MNTLQVVFTKRAWNPISWLIRWAIPRSRFSLSLQSHCMVVDGDYMIEAHMLHGVRRVTHDVALKGLTIVKRVDYEVPDAEAGIAWARNQVGAAYDWSGAFGIALGVDRDWKKPGWWFCYEIAAGAITNAGRDVFADTGHITGSILLAIKP